MEIANKKILVVGLARTGIAAARFLRRRGAAVRATDMAAEAALDPGVAELRALDIDLALGGHRVEDFTAADLIVLSPGVPHTLAPLQAARGLGVPVIGEVELAARFIREPIVAVSGTNGKTTVTELLGRMLEASGRRVFVGGNIGRPLIGYVDGGQTADVVVAEISSFQLDTIVTFRPAVGVLLNITDDHLDRYTGFAAYARSKMRLFENQTAQDTAVLNGADPVIRAQAAAIRSRRLFYNTAEAAENCAAVVGTAFALRRPGHEAVRLNLAPFRLRGPHNVENACAAALAALVAGASPLGIQQALSAFAPLPHRIESVAVVNGVEYVNDSKATNVDAVLRALDCFTTPVVLIMGGLDKGGNFGLLETAVRRRAKALVLVGKASDTIRAALGGLVPTVQAPDMAAAVGTAAGRAVSGDVVLLSPGCASFDMYPNYQARGEDFRQAVQRLNKMDAP
ncbi:MAG TPA: UDP-N-acetylmuramoyl-L-alanine--D-glutamate ligase [Desulfobacterales bacterium]|nr:UDP-N-acetylmuramoyl-L-alanine--D-glutamate ligase [Desulfobacterales bacterium]